MTKKYEYNKKWRKKNPQKRMDGAARYYEKTQNSLCKHQRWTPEEERLVLKHEMSDMKLHELLCRSVQSIQVKRSNLKKAMREN